MSVKEIIDLIADDAFAMSFQSMGQYRSAILRAIVVKVTQEDIEVTEPAA
jgi:hypothetical protein